MKRIKEAQQKKEAISLAFVGNIVDLWEKFADEQIKVDLGSDQTSLHNPWAGGYYPAGLTLKSQINDGSRPKGIQRACTSIATAASSSY